MTTSTRTDFARFPILGALDPGTVQRHEVALPGEALVGERWPVTTVCGETPGPVLFINAGIHGGEYPAIETVIRLGRELVPEELSGTVALMPVVNLPAFWQRSMFVCPVDNLNPNRMFPGSPDGSYTEQLVFALTNEFIAHADLHIDLHGGDIVEDLVPFSVCQHGNEDVHRKSLEAATVFGLPNLMVLNRSVQESRGTLSYVAAAAVETPSFIAEAGGVGQLQPEAVEMLRLGVLRVLHHLGMMRSGPEPAATPVVLHSSEWLYSQHPGMFYPRIATNDRVRAGQVVGTVGSLFGDTLEEITAPVDGRILFLTSNPAVIAGGLLMGLGVSD